MDRCGSVCTLTWKSICWYLLPAPLHFLAAYVALGLDIPRGRIAGYFVEGADGQEALDNCPPCLL